MSNMNVELYEALRKVNIPENETRAAAIAELEKNRSLSNEIVAMQSDIKVKIALVFWGAIVVVLLLSLGLLVPEVRAWLCPSETSF